jgi:carbamoyl-phosphate synthase large subunit
MIELMETNVLLSCSGRQLPLVKAFSEALNGKGKVIVADVNKYASSKVAADIAIESPDITGENYGEWSIGICKKYKVSLWISLLEDELLILEDYRQLMFENGCLLVGAPKENLKRALDKYSYKTFLGDLGITVPVTWTLNELKGKTNIVEGEYILKKRFGRGSQGIKRVNNVESLLEFAKLNKFSKEWIIQPIIKGEEFCLDIINDLDRNYVTSLIRKRYVMGKQETETAETIIDESINEVSRKISQAVKHQGSIDVELIKSKNKLYVIDINVRFGGSYIFSHMSGANIPAALIAWRNNKTPDSSWLRHNTGEIWTRYSTLARYIP